MSLSPPSGSQQQPPRNWSRIFWGVVIFFIIKSMFFSSPEEVRPTNIQNAMQNSPSSNTLVPEFSTEAPPATIVLPNATVNSDETGGDKDKFDMQLQAAYLNADKASDLLKLMEPVRAAKDIHELLGDSYSKDTSDFLTSADFTIGQHKPLSLYEAAKILANTYLIADFEAENANGWLGNNLTEGKLFYTSNGSQYRLIPKLNFQSGDKSYLVFDRLKNDGQYPDCHACQSPISVIKYHQDGDKFIIDNLFESFATLGTWGNSGVIHFVRYANGDEGFVVTNGTINQGILSGWLDAFKVSSTGIVQLTQLSKSKLEPPIDELPPPSTKEEQLDAVPSSLVQLKTAAEGGDAEAQFALATIYDLGQSDVAIDYTQAANWYMKAATQGMAKAQHNLAVLYHDGQGVTKSYEQAYFWLILASKTGDANSARLRDEVERKLSSEQIADIQKRAMGWVSGKSFIDLKPVNIASFDCGKAKSATEIVICSDSGLSDLDKKVGDAYALTIKKYPQKKTVLRDEQREFLKTRLVGCNVLEEDISETQARNIAKCLKSKYEKRLSELGKYIPIAPMEKPLFGGLFKPRDQPLNK